LARYIATSAQRSNAWALVPSRRGQGHPDGGLYRQLQAVHQHRLVQPVEQGVGDGQGLPAGVDVLQQDREFITA